MNIEEKLDARLDKIETLLTALVERQQIKEWYTTAEAARMLNKAEFTVREWCRLGRLHSKKQMSGRGAFAAWVISHDEILRYQREGLIPFIPVSTRIG